MSNQELTQIVYNGLGLQDRSLLDTSSSGTLMSKFKDDVMELIKTVAKIAITTWKNHSKEVSW